jgi:hypothetical protein
MIKKDSKRPRDLNQLAKMIVKLATDNEELPKASRTVERARKAGGRGGPARAKALTPERRSEIAALAAQARWKKG